MGVLAYFCAQHPNALLQVAFVPGFTFTADSVSSLFFILGFLYIIFFLINFVGFKSTAMYGYRWFDNAMEVIRSRSPFGWCPFWIVSSYFLFISRVLDFYNLCCMYRFWCNWGQQGVWNQRVSFLQAWHNFRTGTKPNE